MRLLDQITNLVECSKHEQTSWRMLPFSLCITLIPMCFKASTSSLWCFASMTTILWHSHPPALSAVKGLSRGLLRPSWPPAGQFVYHLSNSTCDAIITTPHPGSDHLAYRAFSWWADMLFVPIPFIHVFIYLLVWASHKTCSLEAQLTLGWPNQLFKHHPFSLLFGLCACVIHAAKKSAQVFISWPPAPEKLICGLLVLFFTDTGLVQSPL